jgi:hypothetical protein
MIFPLLFQGGEHAMGQLYQDAMARFANLVSRTFLSRLPIILNGKRLQMRFCRGKLPRIALS